MATCPKCLKEFEGDRSLWYCPFCNADLKKKVHPTLPLGWLLFGISAVAFYGLTRKRLFGFGIDIGGEVWLALLAYPLGIIGAALIVTGFLLGKR